MYKFSIPTGQVCNLRCNHCSIWQENSLSSLQKEKIFQYLDWFKMLDNYGMVTFYGGEPFLYKDIFDILDYIKEKGLKYYIGSNGTLIKQKIIDKLKETNIDRIFISLDSHIKEVNNIMRGNENAYDLTINAIKLLISNNIKIYLNMILSRESLNWFLDYCDFCDSLGCIPTFNPIEPDFCNYLNMRFYQKKHLHIIDISKLELCLKEYRRRYSNMLNDQRLYNIIDYFQNIEQRKNNFEPSCDYNYIILNNDYSISMCHRYHQFIDSNL